MAAYNPRNFDLGQFMNDLFQQPDLANQLQFLGSHLQVINSYAAGLEIELTRVTAIATTAQAQAQAQPGTLGAAPTSGTSKKVEVFADPGNFSGEINHFEEWWLKMKTWLNINQQTIPARSYDAVVSVLSRMKQKAGTFSAQRLEKGIAYTWAELETDIVKQYRPTARPDWARRKLWSLKQGNTRSCDYVDLFTKYFRDAEIGHSHAIDILEQNMNAEIRDQIVREGKRSSTDVHVYLEAVRTIGETMETMNFLRKGRTGFFPITGSSSSRFQSNRPTRDSNAMDIDALNETWSDVMTKNTLMPSPKENQQNASPDVSTAAQMDILVKIALGHPPSVENAIGPEETTRRLALNSGRSGQSKRKPLKRREKAKQLERSGCSSCQGIL
jgi:hypothetical protein